MTDLVWYEITVTAEDDTGPVLTSELVARRDGIIESWQPMYQRGQPKKFKLSCDVPDPDNVASLVSQNWIITAHNYDPSGGPIYDTSIPINITQRQTVAIVIGRGAPILA